jgi:hypothetical protein
VKQIEQLQEQTQVVKRFMDALEYAAFQYRRGEATAAALKMAGRRLSTAAINLAGSRLESAIAEVVKEVKANQSRKRFLARLNDPILECLVALLGKWSYRDKRKSGITRYKWLCKFSRATMREIKALGCTRIEFIAAGRPWPQGRQFVTYKTEA